VASGAVDERVEGTIIVVGVVVEDDDAGADGLWLLVLDVPDDEADGI
jgi:hypothetical protein